MENSFFKTLRIELIIDKLEIYSIWVSWLKVKRLRWTLRIQIQTFFRLLTLQYQVAMSNFHPDIKPKSGSKWNVMAGDSDVGDIFMLVTLWWWQIWDFSNALNRSPTSVTNINVTVMPLKLNWWRQNVFRLVTVFGCWWQKLRSSLSPKCFDGTIRRHAWLAHICVAESFE